MFTLQEVRAFFEVQNGKLVQLGERTGFWLRICSNASQTSVSQTLTQCGTFRSKFSADADVTHKQRHFRSLLNKDGPNLADPVMKSRVSQRWKCVTSGHMPQKMLLFSLLSWNICSGKNQLPWHEYFAEKPMPLAMVLWMNHFGRDPSQAFSFFSLDLKKIKI